MPASSAGPVVLTVQSLLDEPELGLRLVAGRGAADRPVGGVHISEMPDPTPWLAPRDVLLTTGISLEEEGAQRSLVRRLSEAGVTALGYAAGINAAGAPPALVDEAERVGFPLFEVSFEVPFRTITSYIFTSLLSADMHRLRRSLSVQNHLLSLMLEDKGADHLVSSLSMLLNATAILFDARGHATSLAQHRVRVQPEQVERVWQVYTAAAGQGTLPRELALDCLRLAFREVRTHEETQQVLVLVLPLREHLLDFADVALTFAQKLLALELLKTRDARLLQRTLRADLLDELIAGVDPSPEVLDRARSYQLEPDRPLCVAVFEVHAFDRTPTARGVTKPETAQEARSRLHACLEEGFHERRLAVLSLMRGDSVIMLFPAERRTAHGLRELAADVVRRAHGSLDGAVLAAGLSESFRGLRGVPRALAQAHEAVRLAAVRADDAVVLFSELGPSIRALENQSQEQLELFYGSTVRPLEQHDAETGDDLVASLAAYLEEGRSVTRASRRLFVHQNTLRYRLKKIEGVLGIRLTDTETLVDLFLGLRSRALLRRRWTGSHGDS
ncbi:MAG: PucR family transcriptional regulator [Thermoleophilia bacterium]